MKTTFDSWSYSRWSDWMTCPARAKYRHVEKVKTPMMAAREIGLANGTVEPGPMERGADIAKKAERFLKGMVKQLPIELMPVAETYKALRKRGNLSVEDSWGFTRRWLSCSPTDWNNCWLRIKIDVCYVEERRKGPATLHIRDNKTGKFDERKAEDYQTQLELYALGGLLKMPTIDAVTVQLIYSDLGVLYPNTPLQFSADQLDELQAKWTKRVKPMFADKKFAPRPGYYCRYCDFSKSKGGPCKF